VTLPFLGSQPRSFPGDANKQRSDRFGRLQIHSLKIVRGQHLNAKITRRYSSIRSHQTRWSARCVARNLLKIGNYPTRPGNHPDTLGSPSSSKCVIFALFNANCHVTAYQCMDSKLECPLRRVTSNLAIFAEPNNPTTNSLAFWLTAGRHGLAENGQYRGKRLSQALPGLHVGLPKSPRPGLSECASQSLRRGVRFWLTADSLGFGNPLGLNRDYRVGPVNRRELHGYDYRSPGTRTGLAH
jgi:hypothetical protein